MINIVPTNCSKTTNDNNIKMIDNKKAMSNEKPKSYKKLYAELGEQRKQQFPKTLSRTAVKIDRFEHIAFNFNALKVLLVILLYLFCLNYPYC